MLKRTSLSYEEAVVWVVRKTVNETAANNGEGWGERI